MKLFTVAVLGATGAVGREMLKILEEYDFPVGELRPLASARSAGSTVPFKGQEILVQEAREDSFEGMDIVVNGTSTPDELIGSWETYDGAVYSFELDGEFKDFFQIVSGDVLKCKQIFFHFCSFANSSSASPILAIATSASALVMPCPQWPRY